MRTILPMLTKIHEVQLEANSSYLFLNNYCVLILGCTEVCKNCRRLYLERSVI